METEQGLEDRERKKHRDVLCFSIAVLVFSLWLQVLPSGKVAPIGLSQFPLPESCGSKIWFGVSCPGCGLTRSFVQLAHGDFYQSLHFHRLGWLLFASVVFQIPYRLCAIKLGKELPDGFCIFYTWTILSLLFLNWIAGLFP